MRADPKYIKLDEAAAMLNCHKRTVQRMMVDGLLDYETTPRGYRRLLRASVEQYVVRQRNVDNGDTAA